MLQRFNPVKEVIHNWQYTIRATTSIPQKTTEANKTVTPAPNTKSELHDTSTDPADLTRTLQFIPYAVRLLFLPTLNLVSPFRPSAACNLAPLRKSELCKRTSSSIVYVSLSPAPASPRSCPSLPCFPFAVVFGVAVGPDPLPGGLVPFPPPLSCRSYSLLLHFFLWLPP